jgi:phage terminase large subunit GpA-like protein
VKTRPRNEPLDIAVSNYAALKILNTPWQIIIGQANPVPKQPPTETKAASPFAQRFGRGF